MGKLTEAEAREWFDKYIDMGIDTCSDLTIVDLFLQAGRELGFISDDKRIPEDCENCKHRNLSGYDYPCESCGQNFEDKWEAIRLPK